MKKKIIHFSLADAGGGITQYVLNNWRHIDKRKFQFDMATFGGKLDFQEELEAGGCRVFYFKNRAEDNLGAFREEIRQALRVGYDAVHLHTSYWKSFELEKLAREAGIPKVIVHAHNTAVYDDTGREGKEKRHLELRGRLNAGLATDYWACSQAAAKWLYADRIPAGRIRIMKNAIDVPRFSFDGGIREEYREKLGWGDKYIVGHVGRFSYQKNHRFLLKMFQKLARRDSDARLLLIGRGPLEDSIASLAQEYGLGGKVYFARARDDVGCWM